MSVKPKLLVLGTGWGGTSLCRALRQPKKWDITVASSRDHMLFTPLLTSTATGALEHRSIMEMIRPLASAKEATFLNAQAKSIKIDDKTVNLEIPSQNPYIANLEPKASSFAQPFDVLVISVGATINTFGVPGVNEHACFMKEASHARTVRKRMHDAFEAAMLPISQYERQALLTFVVCGAGPTGVELTAEIADWLHDLAYSKRYPKDIMDCARVILVEASGNILSTFDRSLREYALRRLRVARIEVKLGARVKQVEKNAVILSNASSDDTSLDERVPCGLVVWTAGIGPREVIKHTHGVVKNERKSHLMTDDYLLCEAEAEAGKDIPVFAIGDCASIRNNPLIPIAQVAEQQGIYVASVLDSLQLNSPSHCPTPDELRKAAPSAFRFASKGMLAYVGSARGVAAVNTGGLNSKDGDDDPSRVVKWSGFAAWLTWRYAYFSKLGSFRNKLQVPLDWVKTALFGRDVSSF